MRSSELRSVCYESVNGLNMERQMILHRTSFLGLLRLHLLGSRLGFPLAELLCSLSHCKVILTSSTDQCPSENSRQRGCCSTKQRLKLPPEFVRVLHCLTQSSTSSLVLNSASAQSPRAYDSDQKVVHFDSQSPKAMQTVCFALSALMLGLGLSPVAGADPLRVMFVGNSFTFVNDLPDQLTNIAKSKGIEIQVQSFRAPSAVV